MFADLHRLYPDRIVNKTNGITFRRWLHQANPRLTRAARDACGRRGARRSRRHQPRLAELRRRSRHGRGGSPPSSAPTSRRSARFVHEQIGMPRRPGRAVRRAHQAHPRIQAAAARTCSTRSRATTRSAPIRTPTGCRGSRSSPARRRPSYRQAKLIIKLANDIAARRSTVDPAIARPAAGWCSCRTTMSAWPR